MIDGADNKEVLLGIVTTAAAARSARAEFKLQTNTFRPSSAARRAVINVTTRSGTNEIHGSLYEFLRNSYLDAAVHSIAPVCLRCARTISAPRFGGPIRKNRTFLFATIRLPQRAGQTATVSVPRSTSVTASFSPARARAPFTIHTGAAFLNNTIPANRINPADRSCSTCILPELPGRVVANTGVASNYSGVYVQQQDVSTRRRALRSHHQLEEFLIRPLQHLQRVHPLPPFRTQATGDTPSRAAGRFAIIHVFGDVHISPHAINEFRASTRASPNSFVGI